MAEYVTPPNIHTVLKKYQTTAPKSLQGPGHALASTSTGCMSGGNCSLDGSINGGTGLVGGVAEMHSLVGIRSSPCELTKSEHCSLNTNPCLQTSAHPALPLIKKEILTSPEPAPLAVQSQHPAPNAAAPHTLHNIPEGISPAGAAASTLPPSIKIMPPPPPEVSQPILSSADSGWGELYETRLEGKSICCFLLGGELRLCLPQFLNNVLGNFTLEQINRSFDELGIFCSQCTPDQLMEFKAAKILPSDVKSSGLITRTDAERLCAALLHRSDRNSYINVEDIPKGAISFKVYHHCFGKCEGICTPDMYSYTKPTCIMCLECKGWFSPQKFVGHVHRKVENRTCHWGFDSRYWHDYLHVALDVENREKYQKILDELKEVEIKEQQKTQHEINYLKRKADMNVESAIIVPSLSLPPPPPHQPLPANVMKHRSEQPDIPNTKKPKNLDEAIAYQLEYQHYQSLMYAHCAQQQRVAAAAASSAMSAFRPWPQPKGFHHAYNAVTAAALSTLPYLSQDPPVLQNPERVVRCSDRERFERTYQPNVALAPRKSISSQEHHELREREKERLERERDMDRMRDFERERTRERERQFEREKDLQRKQQQHQQQQQQKHLQAQSHVPEIGNTSIIQIKQERAPTPDDMSPTPPPRLEQNHTDEGQRNSADVVHEAAIPMISPLILSHKQPPLPPPPPSHHHNQLDMQQHITRRHTRSSSSSSSGNSSTPPHPALHLINPPHKLSGNIGGGGGGSVVIDNQKSQTQSAQRNPLPVGIPHLQQQQHQQQQQQQYVRQSLSPSVNCNTNTNTNNSPCNNMRSPEEFGGSNEITSSTSPVPPQQHHNQPLPLHNNAQNVITTVNHHRKLLPSSSSAGSYGANNNHCELTGRIRISRNLINQNNILRSPTPPLPITIPAALQQQHISHHVANNQQQQQQQKYEFFKQKQKHYHSNSHHYIHLQQHHPNQTQLSVNMNPNQQSVQHQLQSPSPTLSSSNDTGLNLSTSASAGPHNTKSHLRASTRNYAHTLNPHHLQHNNKSTLINSEFELSTDTDEDSIHDGEADSSNTMTPWEMAIEALRDARPKDRERLLNMLQRILNENQHYRLQNQQLKELLELRNDQINKLNSDLQHCRRQLEPLKLNHVSRHSNGYIVKQVLKNAEGDMLLRAPPEKSELRDGENYEHMSKEGDNGAANVAAPHKESPKGGEYHQNNWEMSELYRQTVGKEEENVHLKRIKREINESMDDTEMENAQELEKDIQPPMDNTQRQQREDETSATESEQEPEERDSQTTNNHHTRSLKDKLDNGDESNTFLNQKTDENSDAEEREEDDDDDEEEEEEEDGRNSLNHIQAPHSQAISQPPTATTPLSPDSAATAGQLFDSSNSSDASSMKKAQMCASDALAKINAQGTEMEDEDEEGNDDDDDDNEDDDDDDDDDDDVKAEEHKISIINNKFATENETSSSNRGEPEQKDMAGSCPEDYDQQQNGQRKCYGEKTTIYTNDTQASIKQISFPPTVNASKPKPITTVVLATKASKKQTPTTNNDIQIKQEYL